MDIRTKTPCCGVTVVVHDRKKQDRRCRTCHHWWRVDVTLIHHAPIAQGKTVQSVHRLDWTHIGKL